MNSVEFNKKIDSALEDFDRIQSIQTDSVEVLSRRLNFLYKFYFIGIGLVLGALFFLVLVMTSQINHMAQMISIMNTHFTQMNRDMEVMLVSMSQMDGNVNNMQSFVKLLDSMNSSVDGMAIDMRGIRQDMSIMDDDIQRLGLDVADMRTSFEFMDNTMILMGNDVQHMSRPMNMFNQFNPFR